MNKYSALENLRALLRSMERDLGLEDLSAVELDVFLAAQSVASEDDALLTSAQLRNHELVEDIPPATFHRALKSLVQRQPFYALKGSPVNESPLGLFDVAEDGAILSEEYGIATRYLNGVMSPWAAKRLKEFGGDITQFRVVKMYPSIWTRLASLKPSQVMKTIRIFRHWSVRWISDVWKILPRMIRMLTAFPVVCVRPIRVCLNLSKCSKHRSRCCILC